MAQIVQGNQVKLNNGQVVTASTGGWYDGQQFWGNTLSSPGQINSLSNQQGAGQNVSNEVIAQTNPANVSYIEQLRKSGGAGGSTGSPMPGGSGGSTASRSDYVSSLVADFQKQDAARQAASADARTKLQDYYAGLEDPTARLQRLREQEGVGDQQSIVNNLTKEVMTSQDILDAIEPDVNNRIQDYLVDETGRVSLVARERDPLEKNLLKLLRQKEYSEVGLQAKNQLVSELLNLSFKNDEMQAKPLELGVDFTDKDREIAISIFQDLADRQYSAFSDDRAEDYSREKSSTDFANQIYLENLRTQNDISKYNATTGATSSTNKSQKESAQKAEDIYNGLLGKFDTEYDIWNYLMNNREKGANYVGQGIMDELWRLHGSYKAKLNSGTIADNFKGDDIDSLLNAAGF